MKKSDPKHSQESPEQELKRLRKEVAKLKARKEADKVKIENMRKELKKKEEPKPVFREGQWKRILTRLKDIDTPSK